jgi:hypothetical protein
MTIVIDYLNQPAPGTPGGSSSAWDEYEDTCGVLAPVTITADMVVSMTAGGLPLAEDPAPVWAAGTTYALGDRVHLPDTHRVYESAKDANTGKDPSQLVNQFNAAGTATWWIDIGPTNRFAMFDTLISTPTSATSPLVITLRPGAFSGMAMFGLDADYLNIETIEETTGETVYSYSAPLEGSQPADYYEYFFDRFKPQTQFIETAIEPYATAVTVITLTKATGPVKVGMVALGELRPLGAPLRGASVEPVDYSYVSTDSFGNTTIRRRANATGLSIQAKMDLEDANTVLATVQELLGVPVVVVGSGAKGYEALTVFGLLSARLQYDDYRMPTLNMTVKGLI